MQSTKPTSTKVFRKRVWEITFFTKKVFPNSTKKIFPIDTVENQIRVNPRKSTSKIKNLFSASSASLREIAFFIIISILIAGCGGGSSTVTPKWSADPKYPPAFPVFTNDSSSSQQETKNTQTKTTTSSGAKTVLKNIQTLPAASVNTQIFSRGNSKVYTDIPETKTLNEITYESWVPLKIKYTNEPTPNNCLLNGTATFSSKGYICDDFGYCLNPMEIKNEFIYSNCLNPLENGTLSASGTATLEGLQNWKDINLFCTFTSLSSNQIFSYTVKGNLTYNSQSKTYISDLSSSGTITGADSSGNTMNINISIDTSKNISGSGTIKNNDITIIYQALKFSANGSGSVKFTIKDNSSAQEYSGDFKYNSDKSGSGTIKNSSNATVSSVSWTKNNDVAIIYSDGSSENLKL